MASRAAVWSLAVLWVACGQTGQAEDPVEVSEVQRAVPEDHTVSTVAIQVGKSRGSGFFLNFDGDIHFVTAKHVAFDKRKPGQLYDSKMQLRYWSHPTRGSQLGSMTVDLDGAARAKGLQIHNDFDVLAVRIGSGPEGELLRLAGYVSGKGAIITTNRQTLLPFGDVAIGNDVYITATQLPSVSRTCRRSIFHVRCSDGGPWLGSTRRFGQSFWM